MTSSSETSGRVTRLLARSSTGDRAAFDELMPLVYADLRGIASRRLGSERDGHTLDTTALVHEAYLRLVDQSDTDWQGRAHFFAVAARVVRNVLVDHARRRGTDKRGGTAPHVVLREDVLGPEVDVIDMLALDQALTRLATHDARLEQVVVYRFFGGMSMEEAAFALGISLRTAERDWTRARTYLFQALNK